MIMTLVFSLTAAGNLSIYLSFENKKLFKYNFINFKWLFIKRYNFHFVPFAVVFLYGYNLLIPTIFYFIFKSIGSKIGWLSVNLF